LAIKGKGRTRSRRVIAAPPRPQLVVRKPPLWRRRWLRIVVVLIVLAGVGTGVTINIRRSHARHFKAKEVAGIEAYAAKLRATFPADRQIIPPDLVVLFPNLSSDLDKLAKGTLKPADATTEASTVSTTAQAAAKAIDGLNVSSMIPSSFTVTGVSDGSTGGTPGNITARGATQDLVRGAQYLMSQAFQVWSEAGNLMTQAATATDTTVRQALVNSATELDRRASDLFDHGYQKILGIENALGILTQSPARAPVPGA
jgi:hypothetical protein